MIIPHAPSCRPVNAASTREQSKGADRRAGPNMPPTPPLTDFEMAAPCCVGLGELRVPDTLPTPEGKSCTAVNTKGIHLISQSVGRGQFKGVGSRHMKIRGRKGGGKRSGKRGGVCASKGR